MKSSTKLVILAAGRGRRMRRTAPGLVLSPEQREAASRGLKGLIPIGGRPYLDHIIGAAADAGVREICLVVGPGRHPVRERYERVEATRVKIVFAVQEEPLGSAHALLAAESFAGDDPVLVINADNYYPAAAIAGLCALEGNGLAGFRREVLVSRGNIPPERVAAYAIVTADADGLLTRIVEKPNAADVRSMAGSAYVSMTCWRFAPSIFAACRAVPRSARGEYEVPDAVMWASRSLGEQFRIVPVNEPVLDLSCQEDIPSVEAHLRGREVRL